MLSNYWCYLYSTVWENHLWKLEKITGLEWSPGWSLDQSNRVEISHHGERYIAACLSNVIETSCAQRHARYTRPSYQVICCDRRSQTLCWIVHGPDDFRWINLLTKAPFDSSLKYTLEFKKNWGSPILGFVLDLESNLKTNLSLILSPSFKMYIF